MAGPNRVKSSEISDLTPSAEKTLDLTAYHAKYFAYELTKRYSSDSMEKLAGALVDAQVDLNPHQIEAALFAFRSPFSKGAILADEVGLGKTIEAGLVISQKWAERKRRVLVIVPSNLRKQWHQELEERLANLISDSITPRLVPELEILPWRRTHVVAVQVYPGSTRPYCLKAAGAEDGVFVRWARRTGARIAR